MIWKKGTINSKIDISESYKATLKADGVLQKANSLDNGGWGWNYILDSYLEDANIENGTIINSTVVQNTLGNSSISSKVYNVVENHIKNPSNTLAYNINKAFFKRSSFSNYVINNAVLTETKLNDCKVINSRIVNSQVKNSVVKDSTYISEDTIKILHIDEWLISDFKKNNKKNPLNNNNISNVSIDVNDINMNYNSATHKIIKFYIYDSDYEKLKSGDFFYIKGIKFKESNNTLLNFFDKRFKVGNWFDFIDDFNDDSNDIKSKYNNYPIHESKNFYKRGCEYSVMLSTPDENSWKLDFDTSHNTKIGDPNTYSDYYSVDLVISLKDMYGLTYSTDFNINNLDLQDAYIINSHFESGIFETSDWNSGYHINYNNDVNISSLTGSGIYNLYLNKDKKIEISLNTYLNNNSSYSHFETTFKTGDIIFLNNLEYIDNTNKITKLSDTYKISGVIGKTIKLEELNTSLLNGLVLNGNFSSFDLDNRWSYISKTKFIKSKIKSGLFKRNYFQNSLIRNENYNSSDKDFENELNIKSLLISDVIFNNNSNILSSATYMNSFLIGGSDRWHDGIIYNSYLDSFTFSSGVIKESHWRRGNFIGGLFYNSRSFDGVSTDDYKYLDTNRLFSNFRRGVKNVENNRWSWVNGNFYGGEFYKSDWEDGEFKNGKFNYSKFYSGTFSDGVIGDIKNSHDDTFIFNANIDYVTVENATLFAVNPSTWSSVDYKINWKNGQFNAGLFGSEKFEKSIWHDGIFNSGQFMNWAKWKNGQFNGGQFISGLGWTQSGLRFGNSIDKKDYTWEGGEFNGGEFGNSNWLGTNSTWYDGKFNGGEFKGRLWNNGIFTYGNFYGSNYLENNLPASGNFNYLTYTQSSASIFNDYYTQNFYGLWNDGIVTNKVDYTIDSKWNTTSFNNMLWLNGTFSSDVAIMENSLFLDGNFSKGTFRNSSFNPFVNRKNINISDKDKYSFSENAIWNSGNLYNSDFYYSEWLDGNFSSGDTYGMWFKNGISYYMNAYNAIFGSTVSTPIWKDGVWHGSDFDYGGSISNNFIKKIMDKTGERNILLTGTSSNHIWNIFDNGILLDDNGILETSGPIETAQPYYTPNFYSWDFNSSGIPTRNNSVIGKYIVDTDFIYYENQSAKGGPLIYWEGDAIVGTKIYEWTSSEKNDKSYQVNSEKWVTPFPTCTLEFKFFESNPTTGQISNPSYYINNEWKGTPLRIYDNDILVFEKDTDDEWKKLDYDTPNKTYLNVNKVPIDELGFGNNNKTISIWFEIDNNSNINNIFIGVKGLYKINKIKSTLVQAPKIGSIESSKLWFPPFDINDNELNSNETNNLDKKFRNTPNDDKFTGYVQEQTDESPGNNGTNDQTSYTKKYLNQQKQF